MPILRIFHIFLPPPPHNEIYMSHLFFQINFYPTFNAPHPPILLLISIRPVLNYNDKKEDPEDLGRIIISHKLIKGNKVVSGKVLRFLGKPLPQRLVTFDSIEINFLNAEIILWLQNWQPIFESCPLNLSISGCRIKFGASLSATFFLDLHAQLVGYDPSIWQHVQNWLMSPRAGKGTPLRIVNLSCASEPVNLQCIKELKNAFGLATSRASFIVVIYGQRRLSPFSIDNKRTGEELTLIRHDRKNNFTLVRHGRPNFLPKATLDRAAEWLMEEEMHRIVVDLGDDDVGEGCSIQFHPPVQVIVADQQHAQMQIDAMDLCVLF